MATCLQTIQAGGVEELFPSTLTPISFNSLANQVFLIRSPATQTVSFNFVFSPVTPVSSFTITVTAYQKIGSAYIDIGSATFGDLIGFFSKDFSTGEFYLCIRSNTAFTGTVVGNFSGFATEARFRPSAFEGATATCTMANVVTPNPCDEPLYYEIIEGELPPGITMTTLGRVSGPLPNLDCLPDAHEYSPAMNWSYADSGGRMNPWGRTWRFKVRVSLGNLPEVGVDEWFCLRVHNNWTFDRDNFLKNAPFKTVREIEIIEEGTKLPESVCFEPCETVIETPFTPQPITDPTCPVCDEADVITDIQMIKIPSALQNVDVNAMVVWWVQNKDTIFDSPQINKFIGQLRESAFFQGLLAQAGYGKTQPDPRTVIEATAFQSFIQLTSSTLVNGRGDDHLDAMMLKWKNDQNQKLPITAMAWHGAAAEATLS